MKCVLPALLLRVRPLCALGLWLGLGWITTAPLCAQPATNNAAWNYLLLDESSLLDDCLVCGRPPIQVPMRGQFQLRLLEQTPLTSRYAVENLSFRATGLGTYQVTGSGTVEIGGEVALLQHWRLALEIDNGTTNRPVQVIESSPLLSRAVPMLNIVLDQTNGTILRTFYLTLAAAPLRELWFSTETGFTSARFSAPTNGLSGGDLLSSEGRIVKRNREMTRRLGIMPFVPDVGLDAATPGPGGEMFFSINRGIFSEFMGYLQEGDILSASGRVARANQSLLEPFQLAAQSADTGLDALQRLDDGRWLFSVRTNAFSQSLGRPLQHGDILDSTGGVFRTWQQLTAAFRPNNLAADPGLDALYLWPHGEIWFSTVSGFQAAVGAVQSGDILSDAGYIVFRNLELLAPFAPIEDASNFGLDSLVVITDARPAAAPPHVRQTFTAAGGGSLEFFWEGPGQFYQLESAPAVHGPFTPFSPILWEGGVKFGLGASNQTQRYFRLRQW